MDIFRAVTIVILLVGACACVAAAPTVFWASDPVRPDETVVAMGGGLGAAPTVEVARVADDTKAATAAEAWKVVKPASVEPLQVSDHSVKFVVPSDLQPGVFVFRVRNGGEVSEARLLNAPQVWWTQGDQGDYASPGGWVRVFGNCLGEVPAPAGTGPASRARLQVGTGFGLALPVTRGDGFGLTVPVPADLAPGEYPLFVSNGSGGEAGWTAAGVLRVAPARAWKSEVFNVRDFGTDSDAAVRAALAKIAENSGGVLYFPRGRYQLKGELKLPAGTILRGEGIDLVSLYWPDLAPTPPDLISGPQFGLEDLSLYLRNHRNIIRDEEQSVGTFVRRVRIRANCFFMIEDFNKSFRGRTPPASHRDCGDALQMRGRNFEITDCDVYASNYALHIYKGKCGVVARNTFLYGGRGYSIENTDRLILEDNVIRGNNLMAIGNDITTFWTNYCRNIYYARNRLEHMYGADREMMTLDAGGGAYFGKLAGSSGTQVILATDPTYKDYAPTPHTDWTGAAMMVLDGTGAGQWRTVTRNSGREWQVDRPWDIVPDGTSLISIAPHRGRHLFIDNRFADGGAFQLYGAALDTIVARNEGSRMGGFFAWGLNPHDWGWQPCYNCQFLDNRIRVGNAFGGESAFLGAFTSNNNALYGGPLGRGLIFRRNALDNDARIRLHSTIDDVLVENCAVSNSDEGIVVGKGPTNTLLRDNKFEKVTTPLSGEGLPGVKVVP